MIIGYILIVETKEKSENVTEQTFVEYLCASVRHFSLKIFKSDVKGSTTDFQCSDLVTEIGFKCNGNGSYEIKSNLKEMCEISQ